MYAGELSNRDIEDTLREISGDGSAFPSRFSVSRLTEVLGEDYEEFQGRDLSGFDIIHMFSDAVLTIAPAAGGRRRVKSPP